MAQTITAHTASRTVNVSPAAESSAAASGEATSTKDAASAGATNDESGVTTRGNPKLPPPTASPRREERGASADAPATDRIEKNVGAEMIGSDELQGFGVDQAPCSTRLRRLP